ncbi:MAG: helix-turn-helix transcriptional regulator [Clostridiales bacterium]|nr:helix-turn-helix transcriptional regulator [Clostridiales bacterium]MBR4818671.1 helix-turn-helix transcriptional regulator [Clostridiales bacterium]MBR5057144.1 helix-turn-helix transcriptional regulator [Clostridiales bacterium]
MDNVNSRFEVLGDPTRMQILGILGRGNKLRAKDILEHLKISQPTLSHHMQLLTSSKIVSVNKVGRECFYMINEESIIEMKKCLSDLLSVTAPEEPEKEKKVKKDKKKKKKDKKDKNK